MADFRCPRHRLGLPLLCLALLAACGDENADPETTGREGPEGCYIEAQRLCDCAIDEADCTDDVGIWTDGCTSCAG